MYPPKMPISQVPTLGSPGARKLPEQAIRYVNTRSTLEALALTGALVTGVALLMDGRARTVGLVTMGLLLVVGLIVELPLVNRLAVRNTTYTVTSDFVYITYGVLFRKSSFIPTSSIVNIETLEGPLLTRSGLVKVRFRGVTTSEVLGPLEPSDVSEIRETVVPRRCRS